jgi:hypothetical protein
MADTIYYRLKAAELHARAWREHPSLRAEFENLSRTYLQLAEQAERNSQFDLEYETLPKKDTDKAAP